ncbi:MAG TPA: type IX secretion system outer membrane channel protein PorV [Chitinophagales bacterium]|nr:type IX secretion system outer membrane channel protein PorV [Chitinophagales bacterium]
MFGTKRISAVLILSLVIQLVQAQVTGIKTGAGDIKTVTTAVPFLRIDPDAHTGGMGDVGLASDPDVNAIYVNPAKLAFVEKDYGFSLSFSPWLKALVNDIYLASLNGYYKVKKQQTIGVSLRYFSMGEISFTGINNEDLGQFRPNEFAIDVHYSRILGKYFSIAASLRYIYSNLATGQSVDGALVKPGMAGAGDISWYFHKTFNENSEHKLQHTFSTGMDISNIGSKISYTSSIVKDYIPTNLGIGFGYTLDIDKHSSVSVYTDFNKLMVPSPTDKYDSVNKTYYFKEQSSIKGMFTSFGDAPALQELRYITTSIGAEYFYNHQFGVRFGYFYEHPTAGGRQYVTAGLTVKYSVATLHFSYLIPTTIIRNPLDNTLRFTLLFDFAQGGKKSSDNSGVSLVDDTPKKKKKDKEDNKATEQVKPTAPTQTPPAPAEDESNPK